MNYATIKNCDIANGVGVRVSLFVSGCTHRCKNCFNKEKKQIVLGESSAVFTSPYRQTEYYYDEIEQVVETDNTITIFIESEHCYPVYVSKNTVEKGNADIFRVILMKKTDGRYIFAGGKAR